MAESIRVVHLIQNFEVGGLERMVLSLARGAKAHGVVSSVVAYLSNGSYRAAFDAAQIDTTHLPSPNRLNLVFPGKLLAFFLKGNFDILHTHHVGPFIYGCLPARAARLKHVHTEHSRELYNNKRRQLIGRAMDHLATVVCVSDEVARYREKHFGRLPLVIPNGVDVPPPIDEQQRQKARSLIGIESSCFAVGCVARLSPEKDIATLIRGFAHFSEGREGARLIIVGDGEERSSLAKLVVELGLGEKARLLGLRQDVEQLLPGFDIIALSSKREGLPLSLLEGMACGLPAVATAVGGIPDLLAKGGGRTAAPGDEQGLAKALASFADDAELLRREGARARQIAIDSYSHETMVRRYVDIYRSLLKLGHARP